MTYDIDIVWIFFVGMFSGAILASFFVEVYIDRSNPDYPNGIWSIRRRRFD